MVKVDVHLFAIAKDLAGCDQIVLEIDDATFAGDLLRELGQVHPALQPLLPSCRLAVADQYVPDDFVITGQQKVSLIPPVSGG
jgi:molybdopterin converting factor small subunit